MEIKTIVIRIVAAIFMGGLIGYEREKHNRPAGFRTHILVCVGAATVSMIQVQLSLDTIDTLLKHPELATALKVDVGRVVAQVVTGVGFLGAGTIVLHKGSVKGLTTASTIWVVACIGIAIGFGYYKIAGIAGISMVFTVTAFRNLEKTISKDSCLREIFMTYEGESEENNHFNDILLHMKQNKIYVRNMEVVDSEEKGILAVRLKIYCRRFKSWDKILESIGKHSSVISVEFLQE